MVRIEVVLVEPHKAVEVVGLVDNNLARLLVEHLVEVVGLDPVVADDVYVGDVAVISSFALLVEVEELFLVEYRYLAQLERQVELVQREQQEELPLELEESYLVELEFDLLRSLELQLHDLFALSFQLEDSFVLTKLKTRLRFLIPIHHLLVFHPNYFVIIGLQYLDLFVVMPIELR